MADYDLVVRNGTIFDGSGGEGFEGDVAVSNGRIAAVGKVTGSGAEEIDAKGKIVTPGFTDVHTHYDGQAIWDSQLSPSSWHGVTTVVMGNCGVGFAPCRRDDHDRLVKLMEGVEDIPGVVLHEGLAWDWETFPEFLNALESRRHDVDFAAQAPHGPIRVYAMGERGANREPATPDDIKLMARLAREAVEAGALGFTTSRTLNHRTSDNQPTPTLTAAADELVGIANGLGSAGKGVLQVVTDFKDREEEFGMFRRMVQESGRPLSVSLLQSDVAPDQWRWILDQIEVANDDGLEIRAQVCGRPVGMIFGLELSHNPFSAHPAYREIAKQPLEQRLKIMRDPSFREKLLSQKPVGDDRFAKTYLGNFDKMFPLGDPPDYEPRVEDNIASRAQRMGITPAEFALDHMVTTNGAGLIYYPVLNYAGYNLDPSFEMMNHPNTILGLSDGGAHVGTICDVSFPTSMMSYWTRDRKRGPKLSLPWVIKAHARDTARALGLNDRGLLKAGWKADINVIDYDGLKLHAPQVAYDLPAGGRRLIQRADGYDATVLSGVVTYREGKPTGKLPGKLIRGATSLPVAAE